MTKKQTIILTVAVLTIILTNIFSVFITVFTEGLFKSFLYQTENAEFEFDTMPSKGRDIAMMERQFADFKMKNPKYRNLKLFRTFSKNPLKFWSWLDYINGYKYDYPYHKQVKSAE